MKIFVRLYAIIFVFLSIVLFPGQIFAVDITNQWFSTTPIYPSASHVSFSFGNKIYIVGGSAATGQSHFDVISNIPNSDGTLNSWINETNLPVAPIFHSVARKDDNVYIIGGREENSGSINDFIPKVYLGRLNQDGSINNWQEQNPLPKKLGMGAAAIIGDRIYFAGGFNNNEISNKVYSASINADGTLGSWIESGVMPQSKFGFGMV